MRLRKQVKGSGMCHNAWRVWRGVGVTPHTTVEPSVGDVSLIQPYTDEGSGLLENLSDMITKAALLLYPAA